MKHLKRKSPEMIPNTQSEIKFYSHCANYRMNILDNQTNIKINAHPISTKIC